jgi:voltage-dependent calcium channel L type alpha-1D
LKDFAVHSVGSMTINTPFRAWCLAIVEHWLFDAFIIVIIMCNSFLLAYENPIKNVHSVEEEAPWLKWAEIVFMVIYTVEMTLKVLAMGFVYHPNSYLRDPWNVMDFSVVVLSWLTWNSESNVSVIRIIRILRPLRTISAIPALAKLVQNLIILIPPMGEILILFAFTILVFGTIGMSLFIGHLKGRCVMDSTA